jgi:uncharacterized protein DUF6603
MGVKNILKSAVEEISDFLKWAYGKLQDEEAKKEILVTLGLPISGSSNSPANADSSFQSINGFTGKNHEDIDLEAFASVISDIASVATAIKDFSVMISSDDPEIAAEFFDLMFQLYLSEYSTLRMKTNQSPHAGYKIFYQVVKYGDFYAELATVDSKIFRLSSLIDLLDVIAGAFNESNKDWAKRIEGKMLSDAAWTTAYNNFSVEKKAELAEKQIKLATDCLLLLPNALPFGTFAAFARNNIIYGFDSPSGTVSPAADRVAARTWTIATTLNYTDNTDIETSSTIFLSAAIKPEWHGGLGLEWKLAGDLTLEKEFDNGLKISIESNALPTENANVEIKLEHGEDLDRWVIGSSTGTRLEIGIFTVTLTGGVADNDLDFNIGVKNCAFVLDKGKSDSFIASILPENGISGVFDLGIGYSVKKGVYISGGSGITVAIPCHAALSDSKKNNLVLNSFYLNGKWGDDEGGSLETSIGFTGSLLGISATVERMGLLHNFKFKDENKRLSDINYSLDFKPPNGIGLSFDVGCMKGGGFLYLDIEKGEYAGALEVKFGDRVSLKAVGVISTKVPGVDFSLLIIITTEFDPPFPMAMGFSLKGVGGLIGLNRSVRVELLREGVKTNAIRSILFPEDVIANISRIISDIKQIFPPTANRTVFGLMGEFEWGKANLVTIQVGLMVELPDWTLFILGVMAVKAPKEKTEIIRLQINFLGVIDFQREFISYDSSLYDSQVLSITLTGDAAFRLSWGDPFFFIYSSGGFHPAFTETPDDLKTMKRITLSLLSGENPRLTLQMYVAVTSNTFQHGAKVELYASRGSFNIYGFVSYDLLFKIEDANLSFVAEFAAGVSLRRNTSVLMSIHVSGELSGFKPCHIQGKASISFFFFSISVPFSATWGDPLGDIAAVLVDVLSLLRTETEDARNWLAELPANNNLHVTVRKIELPEGQQGKVVIHPFGVLKFTQQLVPLNIDINKFGNQLPKDVNRFEIKTTDPALSTDVAKEQFAAANFFQLKDDEKLARPSFEPMVSGFKITGSSQLQAPTAVSKDVDYELTYLGNRKTRPRFDRFRSLQVMFSATSKGGSVSKSPLSHTNTRVSVNAPEAVEVKRMQFAVAGVDDLKLYGETVVSESYTEALEQYNRIVRQNPGLKERVQIVSEFELNK